MLRPFEFKTHYGRAIHKNRKQLKKKKISLPEI